MSARTSARTDPLRTLAAVVAAVMLLVSTPYLRAAAGETVYRPDFVTQTDSATWDDCTWAAGAMLIDHMTHGRETPSWSRLRRASGDTEGGSTLRDLDRGARRGVGLRVRYSPDGGDPMTWNALLDRLATGGGAVLQGGYSALPREYTRWSPSTRYRSFADSGHAVFLRRYQPENGRVWLMDPLGRGDYRGEWISVRTLKRFAYFSGRYVFAAATPYVASEYTVGDPEIGGRLAVRERVTVSVPIEDEAGRSIPSDLRLIVTWKPVRLDPEPIVPDADEEAEKKKDAADAAKAAAAKAARDEKAAAEKAAGEKAARAARKHDAARDGERAGRPVDGRRTDVNAPAARPAARPAAVAPSTTQKAGPAAAPAVRIVPVSERYRTPRMEDRTLRYLTRYDEGALTSRVRLPALPGTWRLDIRVVDEDGDSFPSRDDRLETSTEVRVDADFAGRLSAPDEIAVNHGVQEITVPVKVQNRGESPWFAKPEGVGPAPKSRPLEVVIRAEWVTLDVETPTPKAKVFAVALDEDDSRYMKLKIPTPSDAGHYALVLRVVPSGRLADLEAAFPSTATDVSVAPPVVKGRAPA